MTTAVPVISPNAITNQKAIFFMAASLLSPVPVGARPGRHNERGRRLTTLSSQAQAVQNCTLRAACSGEVADIQHRPGCGYFGRRHAADPRSNRISLSRNQCWYRTLSLIIDCGTTTGVEGLRDYCAPAYVQQRERGQCSQTSPKIPNIGEIALRSFGVSRLKCVAVKLLF
jgi:hypothetical protein